LPAATIPLADYHWLTSGAAEPFLRRAAEHHGQMTQLVNALRKELSAERAHLVIEQVELRRRAKEKFARADQMFFTRKGLEQATDEGIAEYKARDFWPSEGVIIDICCGIGGDLIALGCLNDDDVGPPRVCGLDVDPVVAHLAQQNCDRVANCHAKVLAQAADEDVASFCTAWHVDPDRRAGGRRVTRIDAIQPDQRLLEKWRSSNHRGGVKLAPATIVPESWGRDARLEWIGSRGECRQQMVWFSADDPMRQATIVDAPGGVRTIEEREDAYAERAASAARYVYEAHGSVLAAGLASSLATEHNLQSLTRDGGYLTSDQWISDGALAAFEVRDILPFDIKRLKAHFREHNIGRLEVKIRGVDGEPDPIRKRLDLRGYDEATLLIARVDKQRTVAIIATRVSLPS
jgi:predicted RNA methylase